MDYLKFNRKMRFSQPKGVSVRRRSAARGCANAHTDDSGTGGGWVGRVDLRVGRVSALMGGYRAD